MPRLLLAFAACATADFSGFTPQTINWGLSVSRPRYVVKLTWNYRGQQRLGAVTGTGVPPGTYTFNPAYLTLNVNGEYRLSRRVGLFAVIRNISNAPLITQISRPSRRSTRASRTTKTSARKSPWA
jgi:hypothetical protein